MKHIFTVCRMTYWQWICNTRMLLLLLAGIFMYVYCIEPMQHYASVMGTPLNILEPFISITNSMFTAPLLPILFLFLIANFPRLDQSSAFVLHRIGRRKWFWGQMLFVTLAGFTYLLLLFLMTIIVSHTTGFLANGWSLAVRQIYEPKYRSLFLSSGISQIDLSVLNQFRPYQAFFISFGCMWGYMILTGAIIQLFTLRGRKMLGVFLNVLANGIGMLLLAVESPLKWLFPSAHVILARHYDEILNNTYLDIKYSFLYDLIMLVSTLYFAWQSAELCSFHIIDATED